MTSASNSSPSASNSSPRTPRRKTGARHPTPTAGRPTKHLAAPSNTVVQRQVLASRQHALESKIAELETELAQVVDEGRLLEDDDSDIFSVTELALALQRIQQRPSTTPTILPLDAQVRRFEIDLFPDFQVQESPLPAHLFQQLGRLGKRDVEMELCFQKFAEGVELTPLQYTPAAATMRSGLFLKLELWANAATQLIKRVNIVVAEPTHRVFADRVLDHCMRVVEVKRARLGSGYARAARDLARFLDYSAVSKITAAGKPMKFANIRFLGDGEQSDPEEMDAFDDDWAARPAEDKPTLEDDGFMKIPRPAVGGRPRLTRTYSEEEYEKEVVRRAKRNAVGMPKLVEELFEPANELLAEIFLTRVKTPKQIGTAVGAMEVILRTIFAIALHEPARLKQLLNTTCSAPNNTYRDVTFAIYFTYMNNPCWADLNRMLAKAGNEARVQSTEVFENTISYAINAAAEIIWTPFDMAARHSLKLVGTQLADAAQAIKAASLAGRLTPQERQEGLGLVARCEELLEPAIIAYTHGSITLSALAHESSNRASGRCVNTTNLYGEFISFEPHCAFPGCSRSLAAPQVSFRAKTAAKKRWMMSISNVFSMHGHKIRVVEGVDSFQFLCLVSLIGENGINGGFFHPSSLEFAARAVRMYHKRCRLKTHKVNTLFLAKLQKQPRTLRSLARTKSGKNMKKLTTLKKQ
ncbi:hypothetical protein HMN09_00157500 [Mycena chlorophos]|uniref:Uncharacterized protein n=1 Tax=Mycena chlorophos TaxID=658473 RepID=A0A8H6WN02_MYCCL|nr:hypothetical protein HMN09_00157500 [Mycena chlorophos]